MTSYVWRVICLAVILSFTSLYRAAPVFAQECLAQSLTPQQAQTGNFILSPTSTHVAYLVDSSGDGSEDLFVVPISGGDPVEIALIVDNETIREYFFHPSGDSVIYRVYFPGGSTIYRTDLNGQTTTLARSGGMGTLTDTVALSPDGSWVVYLASNTVSAIGVYSVPSDGGAENPLHPTLDSAAKTVSSFMISPDSQNVLFYGNIVDRTNGTYLVPIGGSEPVTLGTGTRGVISFSPDGQYMIFAGSELGSLYSVTMSGGSPVRLNGSESVIEGYFLTPDSSTVVYIGRTGQVDEVYSVAVTGGTPVKLSAPLEDSDADVDDVLVSSDGQWVVYATRADVFGVPATGGEAVQLNERVIGFRPITLLSNNQVVYQSVSGDHAIYTRPVDGSRPETALVSFETLRDDNAEGFVVSPDEQFIVFRNMTGRGALFGIPSGGGTPVRLSAEGEIVRGDHYEISADSQHVVYLGANGVMTRPICEGELVSDNGVSSPAPTATAVDESGTLTASEYGVVCPASEAAVFSTTFWGTERDNWHLYPGNATAGGEWTVKAGTTISIAVEGYVPHPTRTENTGILIVGVARNEGFPELRYLAASGAAESLSYTFEADDEFGIWVLSDPERDSGVPLTVTVTCGALTQAEAEVVALEPVPLVPVTITSSDQQALTVYAPENWSENPSNRSRVFDVGSDIFQFIAPLESTGSDFTPELHYRIVPYTKYDDICVALQSLNSNARRGARNFNELICDTVNGKTTTATFGEYDWITITHDFGDQIRQTLAVTVGKGLLVEVALQSSTTLHAAFQEGVLYPALSRFTFDEVDGEGEVGLPPTPVPYGPPCGSSIWPTRLYPGAQGQSTLVGFGPVYDIASDDGNRLGQLNGVFTVLEGPVCVENTAFYFVDNAGLVGWVAETRSAPGSPASYSLIPVGNAPLTGAIPATAATTAAPEAVSTTASPAVPAPSVTPTPVQCPGNPVSRLSVGQPGRVTPGDANNVRDTPSRNGNLVGQIPGGGGFTVVGGPTCAEGFTWVQVDFADGTGWTVEAADIYWLEPAP